MTLRFALAFCMASVAACSQTPDAPGDGGGGAAGGGGTGGGASCIDQPITFELHPASVSAVSWCVGSPSGCSSQWLSIKDPAGREVLGGPCSRSCDTCAPVACTSICPMPQPLSAEGVTQTWDGKTHIASTCGTGSNCETLSCGVPGIYKAVMCAYVPSPSDGGIYNNACSDSTGPAQTCVEVPFIYPTAGPVIGTLPGVP